MIKRVGSYAGTRNFYIFIQTGASNRFFSGFRNGKPYYRKRSAKPYETIIEAQTQTDLLNRGGRLNMAKEKVHEFTVRVRFDKPLTRTDAKREVKDVAEFSVYCDHYTSWGDPEEGYPGIFKVTSVK